MGAQFLIDTNTAIDFLDGKLPAASSIWLEQLLDTRQLALSVVVRIELLSWPGPPSAMQALEDFIAASEQLPLDEPVIQQTISLRQQHRIKLPDAIIAATALVHELLLVTRNIKDFQIIAGLRVVNPHDTPLKRLILVQNGTILIPEGDDGGYYRIRIAELSEIRGNNDGLSEWVMQLLDKTWINSDLLYGLAVLIQKMQPANQINWRNTFTVVEKKLYLDKAREALKMADEPNTAQSSFEEVLSMIKLGQAEANPETDLRVKEVVEKSLMDFGLLS